MAKVLQDTVTAFDRRQIVTELSALTAFRNLMGQHPTLPDDVFTVQFAASAEMYLRAGVFGAPGDLSEPAARAALGVERR
jgi:hypothetical protein